MTALVYLVRSTSGYDKLEVEMLWNPQHDIYSLEAFTKWLGEQKATKEYDYIYSTKCAAAQYLQSRGIDTSTARYYGSDPQHLRDIGWLNIVNNGRVGHTFGGAYKRALAELEKRKAECLGV